MTTSFHSVGFLGAGRRHLAGALHLPAGHPRAFALFVHCLSRSQDAPAAARIAETLAAHGLAVLRVDAAGAGERAGSVDAADVVAAAGYLRERHQAPRLLVGHGVAGTATLLAAAEIPEAVAVATIAAPAHPGGPRRPPSPSLAEVVADLGRALLVCHAPQDEVVAVEEARVLFDAAAQPKSFVALDGADHRLTDPEAAAYAAGVIAAWSSRYVSGTAAPSDHPDAEQGLVEVRGGVGLAQDVVVGGHRLRGDEPSDVGGTDTGPNPYDFLLTALGTCISMTLRLYADRKQFPLEEVEVALRHDKIHAADCADCETRAGRVDEIQAVIVLGGDLTDAQRARLLEIAGKCPVHRTLKSEIAIHARLADR